MMTENQARDALKKLVEKYLISNTDKDDLIKIIEDQGRPSLPIKGVLEKIRKSKTGEYSDTEKKIIEELLYLYG